MLLEEPRMEAAHIRRRPDDRHWLRASATNLILADTDATDPARAPKMTTADAAHTAALLLARVDGGVLTRAEVAPVARVVKDILGTDTLKELRALWREALRTADDDGEAMIDLGRRWCETVGTDPDTPTPEPDESGEPDPSDGPGHGSGNGSRVPSRLTKAIEKALAKVARAVADETPPEDPAAVAAATKAAEDAVREAAEETARTVFSGRHHGIGTGYTATAGTRTPTADERTAARVLARALSTAGVRDWVAVKSTSPVPPGRLRMRGALAADAQRAAGAIVTAEPFTRTTRRTVPTPPLRLGIACDVSASMEDLRRPVASTAWILAHAARHATVPAETATVIFGASVRPITHPGTAPDTVTEFEASDGWEAIATATAALDGALGLSQPGAARLLVIISDGYIVDGDQLRDGQRLIKRLRASGCGVLWLTSDDTDEPFDGVTVHQLGRPHRHRPSHRTRRHHRPPRRHPLTPPRSGGGVRPAADHHPSNSRGDHHVRQPQHPHRDRRRVDRRTRPLRRGHPGAVGAPTGPPDGIHHRTSRVHPARRRRRRHPTHRPARGVAR